MEPDTLYLTRREDWRKWLSDNFDTKTEVWLVYPKKSTGKPRIEYNTAVEEALCFGWIDSTVKSLDQNNTIQRFSVRRTNSGYSQANKERIRWLIKHDIVHPSIQNELESIAEERYEYPSDIIAKLKDDYSVWNNFQNFSDSYKRIRIAYIDSARKRPDEFRRRIQNFIDKTRKNKLIKGFGGIDKYY